MLLKQSFPLLYNKLKSAILQVQANNCKMQVEYKAKGLSEMRFRWDLLHVADRDFSIGRELYACGLNDEHIDSALKHITNTK